MGLGRVGGGRRECGAERGEWTLYCGHSGKVLGGAGCFLGAVHHHAVDRTSQRLHEAEGWLSSRGRDEELLIVGHTLEAAAALLDPREAALSDEDLAELEKMIRKARKERRP